MAFNFKRFWAGINLKAKTTSTADTKGDLEVIDSTGKLGFHNGSTVSPVVTESHSATLTNKTIDAAANVVSNLDTADLAAGVLNISPTLAGATNTQVPSALAVKTITDAITADVTDDVEGPASSTDNALVRFDGVTGKLIKNSSVTLDDSGVLTRSAGLVLFANAGNLTFTPAVTGGSTFNYSVRHLNSVFRPSFTDATAGANVALTVGDKSTIVLTAATSVDTLTPYSGATDGQLVTLINGTASPITINNETGAALGGRIRTGSGTSHILPIAGSISLIYSTALSRWSLSGGNTALVDHLNDTVDAHDASAISNVPSGNLAATDVQTALNELQTDIDTSNTNLTAHLNDTIDAHDASAISNVPVGNLIATDVQAALNELQTDVDTRATSASLSAHEAATAVHGATGAVVGTTNVQTLTNKTLTAPVINSPTGIVKADVGLANVDNTSDLAKPISTATQTALDLKAAGAASSVDNHLARFDGVTGKIIQDGSPAVLSDAGALSGLTGLTSSGDISSTGKLVAAGLIQEGTTSDGSTTGANANIAAMSNTIIRLSNASLSSIDTIASPITGQNLTIINQTGNTITINNDTGATVANRILTGTGDNLTLADQASILLKYDATETRWMIIGGSGAATGGAASLDTIFQLTGTELLSTWSSGNNATFLGGGVVAGTFAYNTTTPLSGVQSYKYTQAAGSLNDYLASPAQDVDLRFRGQDVTLFFPFKYDGATNDIEVVFYDVTNAAIIPSSSFLNNSPTVSIFKSNITIPTTCSSIRVGFQTDVLNSGKILEFADVQLTSDTTVYAELENITEWQSYTPTLTGFGTATSIESQWRQVGGNHEYRIKFTSGTPTATEARISLASNAISASTSIIPSIQIAGNGGRGNTATSDDFSVLIEPSVAYLTLGVYNSTSTPLVKQNASSIVAASDVVSIFASVPIAGLTATSNNILTAPETFSSDTAAFTYAGSATYTLATLANAPVGTYITYTYAASTNTRTQTTTRPTQTDADMNANGMLLTTRVWGSASTSTTPSVFAIQIGKGLKGKSLDLYKTTAKSISGSSDFNQLTTAVQQGVYFKDYSETTGILTVDCGYIPTSAGTVNSLLFSDLTTQTSGYLVINASKNPALTGMNVNRVAARGVNTAATSCANAVFTAIPFDTAKTYDTHGALNAATGVFTAPESGYYQVSCGAATNGAFSAVGEWSVFIYKNGAAYVSGTRVVSSTAATINAVSTGSDTIYLAKNDTLALYVLNQSGATRTLIASTLYNFMSICKQGN